MKQKGLVSTADIARLTGLDQRTIQRKAGSIPGRKSGRDMVFEYGPSLRKWIRENTLEPAGKERRGRKRLTDYITRSALRVAEVDAAKLELERAKTRGEVIDSLARFSSLASKRLKGASQEQRADILRALKPLLTLAQVGRIRRLKR